MKPEEMKFTKEHEWVAFDDGSGEATIGITDYAAGELGDIVFIELPAVGSAVKYMEPMGTIEAVKTVADIFSPVTGVVKEINADLEDHPEIVNSSPYGEGWFLKVEVSDRKDMDLLMSYNEYQAMIGKG